MAKDSKDKKKDKKVGSRKIDPKEILEKMKKVNFGPVPPPKIVRPGRCGGCDLRV